MTATTFELKTARRDEGLSLRNAAEKIGIDHVVLWRAERGTVPALSSAKKIADFYGKRVTEIWPVHDEVTS